MKFIIKADSREALMFGAGCCFDMAEGEYKLCGYADGRFFASAKKTKEGVSISVMPKGASE